MKKFLIVDGNSIFYRAFYAMPSLTAPSGEPTGAVFGFANILLKILREREPDLVAVAFDTAKKTFRNEIFSDYKATRPPMPDELAAQRSILREFIDVIGIKTCAATGYEADDVIGTLAGQACESFFVEILTGDRDAFQLINATTNVLFNTKRDVTVYDEQKFRDEFGFAPALLVDFKGLSGDKSDNIPGVKGIGTKTATDLIKTFGTVENILAHRAEVTSAKIRDALENSAELAATSKRLAQIVRDVPDITFAAENFVVTPDLARAEDFCDRYALNRLRQKIHELFDAAPTIEPAAELKPIDFAKIFPAETVTIARAEDSFAVKIFGGEIFSATAADVQRLFDNFTGKIILRDVKKFLHEFNVRDLTKVFDADLAAYLLHPERDKPDLATDAAALESAAIRDEKFLDDADLTKLYREIELPLTDVLCRMENRGVFVDRQRLQKKSADMSRRIAALEMSIYELAGTAFNINSHKQLGDVLFNRLNLPHAKKTKSGYSTDAEVLENLRGLHPIIGAILDFRALTKLKSTYLDGLCKLIGDDGRVHTNFNQMVTATGRLSSSDPNLQNIPVRTAEGREIRALFEPGDGFDCIVSADYSQIELRLLAHMSGDENLIDAFRRGQDIHARTAAEVFSVDVDAVSADLRRKAKAVNFGIVYGISDYGLARDLHITRKEAADYIARYFARYPGVKNFLDETIAKARTLGYVTTMFGRRRTLPNINGKNFNLRAFAERVAMNTPIQGSAADIIKLAMIRAEENLRDFKSRIIIQVHDELVLEARADELAAVEQIVRSAMEGVADLSVPLVVDVHHGANWSLAK
ncbi:MAG: DNA polymerase I [Quinella sp. 2Q5]|nr:DNA polymerase I [Quinella sp. 2Q5]